MKGKGRDKSSGDSIDIRHHFFLFGELQWSFSRVINIPNVGSLQFFLCILKFTQSLCNHTSNRNDTPRYICDSVQWPIDLTKLRLQMSEILVPCQYTLVIHMRWVLILLRSYPYQGGIHLWCQGVQLISSIRHLRMVASKSMPYRLRFNLSW